MADATPSRIGQVNGAGDDKALFLKIFGGEVMTTFRETNVMMPLHMVREIASGKSAQFPATGVAAARYHVPGTEITGQVIKSAERVINIDSLCIADVFIPNIDEAMNHYDYRRIYSGECGVALADKFDSQVFQVGVLAARSSSTITGGNGGSVITDASLSTNGANLAASIFACAQKFDEKKLPMRDEKYFGVRPAQYYLLAQTTQVLNRDWGGRGSYADGEVLNVAGIKIVKSNHVPNTNVAAESGVNNTYDGNFSTTVALAWHRGAMGTVKLLDLATEMEYDIRRQGTLIVAKYAMGHGILRPECAIELKTA